MGSADMIWTPPPDRAVYNLDVAYGIVHEKLSKVDVRQQCERSGTVCQPDGTVSVIFLHEVFLIDVTAADVALLSGARALSLREKILILHYFVQAKGTPLTGKQITYRQLPGGMVYYPTFVKRTIQSLTDCFGDKPQLLVTAGKEVGAKAANTGDVSIGVDAFPRVPIDIVLWQGDSELPAQMNLLFDGGIIDYLESEDVTVVCEMLVLRLINAVSEG
jgi:hypothetical protein